jgi:hypothetical protein
MNDTIRTVPAAALALVALAVVASCLAQPPRLCRIVAQDVLAQKMDAQGRRLFLVGFTMVPWDRTRHSNASPESARRDSIAHLDMSALVQDQNANHDANGNNNGDNRGGDDDGDDDSRDDDNDLEGGPLWVAAVWLDSAQRQAFQRSHAPGAILECAEPHQDLARSDPGAGPRIAAFCAAAVALAVVLGCGVIGCICKGKRCCRDSGAGSPALRSCCQGDDQSDADAIAAHRLVTSVFG